MKRRIEINPDAVWQVPTGEGHSVVCDERGCRIVSREPRPETHEEWQERFGKALDQVEEEIANEPACVPQHTDAPVKVAKDTWITRVSNHGWVPLPSEAIQQLGWDEGTELELFSIMNGQVIIRKRGALKDDAR